MQLQSNNQIFVGDGGLDPSYLNQLPSQPKSERKRKVIIASIVLSVVFILVASGIGGYSYLKDGQNRKIKSFGEQYVTYLAKGEYQKAYELSGKNIKQSRTIDQFGNAFSDFKTPLPVLAPDQKVIIDGNTAYFYQTVNNLPKTTDGRTSGVFALTLKNDNGWTVTNISVE